MQFGTREIFALVTIVLAIVAVSVYVYFKNETLSQQNSAAGKALLGSEKQVAIYTDLSGNTISLEDYNGRARVVNSWATWCPYCVNELQDFSEIAGQYDDNEVVFIAINRGERREKVQSFLSKIGAESNLVHVLNPNDSFYNVIGGSSMPETVFFDEAGEIIFHVRGVMKKEDIEMRTKKLLEMKSE